MAGEVMTTHAELWAGISRARLPEWSACLDCVECGRGNPAGCVDKCMILGAKGRNRHCDDLAALLYLSDTAPNPGTQGLMRALIADRLRQWGVLDFYEDDEPVDKIVEAFNAGPHGVTRHER